MRGKHSQRRLEVQTGTRITAAGQGTIRGPGNIAARIAADPGMAGAQPARVTGAAPAGRAGSRFQGARLDDDDPGT
jgi:hypothetical protein